MEIPKILWLEDQHEDFDAYKSELFRNGYIVENVRSVSEAEKRLSEEENYIAIIFDIKVLPGDDPKWLEIDKKIRKDNPDFDSYLGLELLRALFRAPKAKVKIEPPIDINPQKVIVFSVVYDITEEISSFGVPGEQIIYKADGNVKTFPLMIEKIQKNVKG